jgi:hypothetical protein
LSIEDFDQALEDVVPEDMLSEPTVGDMMDVCSEILDMGLEVSRAVSRASSTLEGSLRCQEVGQDCLTPMEVTEDPLALEVAVAENPAPEGVAGSDPALVGSASCYPAPEGVASNDPAPVGGASNNPAPEGVQVISPSHTSMDVHVGSSPPRSDGVMAMNASLTSSEQVALEVSEPDARILLFYGSDEGRVIRSSVEVLDHCCFNNLENTISHCLKPFEVRPKSLIPPAPDGFEVPWLRRLVGEGLEVGDKTLTEVAPIVDAVSG